MVIAIGCGFLMPNEFMKGLVLGAALVAGPGGIWMISVQVTGSAPVMMGDQAEQWTAQELRKLNRKGWRLVNHFVLGAEDVDHVLMGPGGAFVVETKWSASSWRSDFGRARQQEAVAQARANARRLRLWHPFKTLGFPVKPVVVLWGRGLSKWPEEEQFRLIDDVPVVTGPALPRWREGLGSDALTSTQIVDGWAAMEAQVSRRDPLDAVNHPVPASLAEWVGRCSLTVVSAAVALTIFGTILRRSHSIVLDLAAPVALAAAAMIPLNLPRPPWVSWASWAWIAAFIVPSSALAVAEVVYRLR